MSSTAARGDAAGRLRLRPPELPLRLAVLLSGGGRTLQNLAETIRDGGLDATIALVVSSHRDAYGLERARALELPATTVDYRDFPSGDPADGSKTPYSAAITAALDDVEPHLVLLAGFLRRWVFPDRYRWKVLNIHPALLPAFGGRGFYGGRVHRAVVESGAKFSGCTVHFADHEYDTGPIIVQRSIPVRPDDDAESLAERVFHEECIAYPEAVRLYAEGRLEVDDGRVLVRDPA